MQKLQSAIQKSYAFATELWCLQQNIVAGLSTTTKLPLLHNHLFSFHHPFLLSPLSYLHQGFFISPTFPKLLSCYITPSDSLLHNIIIPSKQGGSHLSLQFCTITQEIISKANIPFYFLSTTSLFSAGTAVSDWKKNIQSLLSITIIIVPTE